MTLLQASLSNRSVCRWRSLTSGVRTPTILFGNHGCGCDQNDRRSFGRGHAEHLGCAALQPLAAITLACFCALAVASKAESQTPLLPMEGAACCEHAGQQVGVPPEVVADREAHIQSPDRAQFWHRAGGACSITSGFLCRGEAIGGDPGWPRHRSHEG